MAKAEALDAVARFANVYRQELRPGTIEAYVQHMQDIDATLLKAAVEKIIGDSKFFPSIAEIRETAARIAGILPPSPGEALEIVRRADVAIPMHRSDGSVAYVERGWEWPDDLPEAYLDVIRDALAKVGDARDEDGKPRFGFEQSFQKQYEITADPVRTKALGEGLSRLRLPSPGHGCTGAAMVNGFACAASEN